RSAATARARAPAPASRATRSRAPRPSRAAARSPSSRAHSTARVAPRPSPAPPPPSPPPPPGHPSPDSSPIPSGRPASLAQSRVQGKRVRSTPEEHDPPAAVGQAASTGGEQDRTPASPAFPRSRRMPYGVYLGGSAHEKKRAHRRVRQCALAIQTRDTSRYRTVPRLDQ